MGRTGNEVVYRNYLAGDFKRSVIEVAECADEVFTKKARAARKNGKLGGRPKAIGVSKLSRHGNPNVTE